MRRASPGRTAVLVIFVAVSGLTCSKKFTGPSPSPQSLIPSRGWTGVDTTITIMGSGFAPMVQGTLAGSGSISLPTVVLRSSPALTLSVTFADTTEIRAVVPAGAPVGGPYGITVTNPNGNSGTLSAAYTVTATPLIGVSSIYPNFGWTLTQTTVYISGDGFTSTPTASLVSPTTGALYALNNVAFINPQSLSAIVPPGLPVGGAYSLTVINPDGDAGVLPGAFTVTGLPPPYVASVDPGQATTNNGVTITVTGSNFRLPLIEFIDSAGQAVPCTISVTVTSATTLTATVPAACLGTAGVYLLRVTDQDEGSFYDWSAFVVTNPASNPGAWQASPATNWLTKGRVGLGVTSGRDDLGRIYLYAVGGASGVSPTGPDIFNDAEVVQLDPFGRLGTWHPIPNPMATKRFGLGAAQFNGWVYAVGGAADGSTPTTTSPVEKAKILTSDTAPQDLRAAAAGYGSLGAGTWYYRVSAVMSGSDPENPGGEGLPSGERVITIAGGNAVGLTWSPPARNPAGVAYYTVYRTDYANGVSGSEHLIITSTTASYTDSGAAAGAQPYVPNGGLGVFSPTSTGFTPVFGLSVVVGHDASSTTFLYAIGGNTGTGATGTVQYARIDPTTGNLFTWQTASGSVTARYFLAAAFADAANSPNVGPNNYVYALGGTANGSTSLGTVELGSVAPGGNITSWASETSLSPANRGLACIAVDNWIFDIDGWQGAGPSNKVDSAEILNSAGNVGGWTGAGTGNLSTWSRYLGGSTLESAYIYLIGGYGSCQNNSVCTAGPNTALQTVEEVLW